MKTFFLLLFITIVAGFSSCKNKLEVFAPGEESVSVYGLLNANENVQTIRINKVYLTNGDALTAGQDNSQINYGAGELMVTLQRFTGSEIPTLTTKNNPTKKEIVLTETVVTTQGGSFATGQRLWQTTDRLFNTGDYRLTIKNNITGAIFTSQTTIIDSVKTSGNPQPLPILYFQNNSSVYPMHGLYPANPISTDRPKYVSYDISSTKYSIKFRPVADAMLYDVVMRFHYIDSLIDGSVRFNFIDYNFESTTVAFTSTTGPLIEDFSFLGSRFYENVASEIIKNPQPNLKNRRSFYMEYIVQAGAANLSEFLQINAPSNSIAQDKPYYTNIKGGVGIFSSRSTTIVTKDMWNDFIDKIACHPSTFNFGFCNSSGVIPPTPCSP